MTEFETDLRDLLNKHSMENGSNTPDFILSRFLSGCLVNFSVSVVERDLYFGRGKLDAETVNKPPSTDGNERAER